MKKNTSRAGAYAGYLISGAAIGAALGVLFAPKAGSESRDDMNLWLKEKRVKSRGAYRAMKEALESRRRELRAKARKLAGV